MKALERSLELFVNRCDIECAGGPSEQSVILEDLAKGNRGCAC